MGVSKKPRKKYKPKAVRLNAYEYAVESSTPLVEHEDYAVKHKLRVHDGLTSMVQGRGDVTAMTYLYAAYNVALAITDIKGLPSAIEEVLVPSLQAIESLADRYRATKRYTLKANEIKALQTMVEYHDELLDHITVLEMEQAIKNAKAHIIKRLPDARLRYMTNEAGE